MKTLAIDAGFGYTKATDGKRLVTFPSVVGHGVLPRFTSDLARDGDIILRGKGGHYFVGECALTQCKHLWDTRDRTRTDAPEYGLLFDAAFSELVDGEPQVSVITGLPIQHYGDRDKVRNLLVGPGRTVHRVGHGVVHFAVTECTVVVQGFGVLCKRFLDTQGNLVDKNLASGRVAVVDLGRYNTNLVLFDALKYSEANSNSLNVGMVTVHEALAQDILAQHGLDLTGRLYQVDRALVEGRVNVAGKPRDVAKFARPHVESLADTVLSGMRSLWGNALDVDLILISGGGASTVGQSIARHHRQAQVMEGSLDNVKGMYSYGLRLYK